MKLHDYLPNHVGAGMSVTHPDSIREGGRHLPIRSITQIIGGRGWSLAVIRVRPLQRREDEDV